MRRVSTVLRLSMHALVCVHVRMCVCAFLYVVLMLRILTHTHYLLVERQCKCESLLL